MSVPPNIDLFNRFTLDIFQRLYLSFPVAIDLDVRTVLGSVTPPDATFDESFDAVFMASEAMRFLASEGFLTHQEDPTGGHQCLQVRLTMKGLAVLGRMPASLERKESLISKILAVGGKGIKDAASEQVQELASQAFTFMLASAPTIAGALAGP